MIVARKMSYFHFSFCFQRSISNYKSREIFYCKLCLTMERRKKKKLRKKCKAFPIVCALKSRASHCFICGRTQPKVTRENERRWLKFFIWIQLYWSQADLISRRLRLLRESFMSLKICFIPSSRIPIPALFSLCCVFFPHFSSISFL